MITTASPSTVRRGPRYSKGSPRSVSRTSVQAAHLYRAYFTKPSKCYGIGKNKLTMAKHTGGALADLMDQMTIEPAFAQPVAARIQTHADTITASARICLIVAARNEQVKDGLEDVSELDALSSDDADVVRQALQDLEEAIAAGRQLAIAYEQRIAELEKA